MDFLTYGHLITATSLARDEPRPCLNPRSVLWPEWPREVRSQKKPRRDDQPVEVLNP